MFTTISAKLLQQVPNYYNNKCLQQQQVPYSKCISFGSSYPSFYSPSQVSHHTTGLCSSFSYHNHLASPQHLQESPSPPAPPQQHNFAPEPHQHGHFPPQPHQHGHFAP